MELKMPLRYEISDWRQLKGCYSNNSRKLKIEITTFTNNDILRGLRIQVVHEDFGPLYTTIIDPKGSLISRVDGYTPYQQTTAQVLEELAKFGFIIVYKPVKHLCGQQIEYLMTINRMGYDKLRVIATWDIKHGEKVFHPRVVAFNSDKNPKWLNSGYSPSMKEFNGATLDGSVCVIPDAKKYDWTWLFDFVANIDDVLKDNVGILGGEGVCQ